MISGGKLCLHTENEDMIIVVTNYRSLLNAMHKCKSIPTQLTSCLWQLGNDYENSKRRLSC